VLPWKVNVQGCVQQTAVRIPEDSAPPHAGSTVCAPFQRESVSRKWWETVHFGGLLQPGSHPEELEGAENQFIVASVIRTGLRQADPHETPEPRNRKRLHSINVVKVAVVPFDRPPLCLYPSLLCPSIVHLCSFLSPIFVSFYRPSLFPSIVQLCSLLSSIFVPSIAHRCFLV
jgi:hypothetical protein